MYRNSSSESSTVSVHTETNFYKCHHNAHRCNQSWRPIGSTFYSAIVYLMFFLSSSVVLTNCYTKTSSHVKRSIHAPSLVGRPLPSDLSNRITLSFASHEDTLDEPIYEDGSDFIFNTSDKEDFDKLFNMLSRSGPAKPEKKHKDAKNSIYLDEGEEEVEGEVGAPHLLSQFKGTGFPTARPVQAHEEDGSHFEDLEKEKDNAEQRRLAALYFDQIHDHKKEGHDSPSQNTAATLSHAFSFRTALLITTSLCLIVI